MKIRQAYHDAAVICLMRAASGAGAVYAFANIDYQHPISLPKAN